MPTFYITLFLRFVSNDSSTAIWIGFAINVLACIGGFFLVESPAWLLSVDREADAMKALMYIAKVNGT